MKILITHTKPHLDDITGIWLYRKYKPTWKKAGTRFIPTDASGGKPYGGPVDSKSNIIHIGICRGKYDEHKGDIGKSAAVLVWEDLKKQKLLPKDKIKTKALKQVIDYVLADDLGFHFRRKDSIYEIASVLLWIPESQERLRVGCILLDALLNLFIDRVKLDQDWKKRKEFKTKWGKGIGLVSEMKAGLRAYEGGFVLVAQVGPKCGYRSIRARADSKVDLTQAYKKVKELEPKADWYLHHSKRMLICGSPVAPKAKRSKLSLKQLIELVWIR